MRKRMGTNAGLFALSAAVVAAGIASAATFGSPGMSFSRSDFASSTPSRPAPVLDKVEYDKRLLALSHVDISSPWYAAFLHGTTTPLDAMGNATTTKTPRPLWPVRRVYPNAGALLPFNRIVAYYGNFYSKGMGVLGQYPEDVMLAKLASTTAAWEKADPNTPVIPAIHYIVETAQASPTKSGLYLARMPDDQIDKALAIAAKIHGAVFIDFQVGLSTLQKELPMYVKYLAMPNVHLGIDPEFAMHGGAKPGTVIGSFDAADINYAINFLAGLVKGNHIPPKILVIHRFTEEMVTHYKQIAPLPEVQVVIDMDGWGFPAKKVNTYNSVVAAEPVQFTGFKLFYKNDLQEPVKALMTPREVLNLTPSPVYIQYQ